MAMHPSVAPNAAAARGLCTEARRQQEEAFFRAQQRAKAVNHAEYISSVNKALDQVRRASGGAQREAKEAMKSAAAALLSAAETETARTAAEDRLTETLRARKAAEAKRIK